jgi:hypothetical protein
MLTTQLEKLILCGKASYKTFVIGGAGKNVLNVKKDRFIIITDLTYFSSLNTKDKSIDLSIAELNTFLTKVNTQLKIFSSKSNNKYIFRNNFTYFKETATNTYHLSPQGNTKLDTYLVHESSVSFTFSVAGDRLSASPPGINKSEIGFPAPYDYGIEGQPGALLNQNVTKSALGASNLQTVNGGEEYILRRTSTAQQSLELVFPVDGNHLLPGIFNSLCYPLLNVGYVEIFGNPTNLQATQ